MRSLLISASILAFGLLAALPFRKPITAQPSTKSNHSNHVAYCSPLQEVEGLVNEDLDLGAIPVSSRAPLSSSAMDPVEQATPLPTSHKPITHDLVDPSHVMNQAPDHTEVATARVDSWTPAGPLTFQTPPETSQIANSAGPAAPVDLVADTASSAQTPATTPQAQMDLQWAGLRGGNQSPASDSMAEAPPQPRKRYFIYEPAN